MSINTEKALAEALMKNQNKIECGPKITPIVKKIKAVNAVAWSVAIAAIIAIVAGALAAPLTGGASSLASSLAAAPVVGVLGMEATVGAISVAIAAKDARVLTKIRDYDIQTRKDGTVVMIKKTDH